jgi:hypothetical protein
MEPPWPSKRTSRRRREQTNAQGRDIGLFIGE